MASGLKPTSGNHFEAIYEHPWGGVASDAYKTDIAPNQLAVGDGINIKNGRLNGAIFDTMGFNFANIISRGATAVSLVIHADGATFVLDNLGNLYNMIWSPTKSFVFLVQNAACTNALGYKIIGNNLYIFTIDSSYVIPLGVYTFTLNSNFVGGYYNTVLSEYLILANTQMLGDVPAYKANRVNWSSPDGFAIWDPSVDRSAGYNTIADVADQITGLFTMGNVGLVLRGQGLTQMTPTGIGIQPFDFTPLWTSEFGIGCTFPKSFAQFGHLAIWGNTSGFYLYSYGGVPQEITKQAKSAIFSDIQYFNNFAIATNVFGAIYNSSNTDAGAIPVTPDLRYTIAIFSQPNTKTINLVFWTYVFNTGVWTRTSKVYISASDLLVRNSLFTSIIGEAYIDPITGSARQLKQIPVFALSYLDGADNKFDFISLYEASLLYPAAAPNYIPLNIQFRAEEIKIGRQPNIRDVLIVAKGRAGRTQTLQVTLFNDSRQVAYTSITISDDIVRTYRAYGIFTDERPQVAIQSADFDGCIIKVMAAGTYADGEVA